MPSFKIHKKYGKMLEISESVQTEVDKYIDNLAHHDFYDQFIKSNVYKLRYTKINYDFFNFDEYLNSTHKTYIEQFGNLGIRCFILHIILDKIERRVRKRGTKSLSYVEFLRLQMENKTEQFKFFSDSAEFWDFIDNLDRKDRLGPFMVPRRIYALIFNCRDIYLHEFENVRRLIIRKLPEILDDIILSR